jgi:uroporphyrinogen decarboxylase
MNDRLVRACRRLPVDATPVWFMRQAGRALADYRRLRERYGMLELAKSPDLCAEVTLMPVRQLGVDGAVMFADIMLPLEPMGVSLRIEPDVGPIIDHPIRSEADVRSLRAFDPEGVSFTLQAIRAVKAELAGGAAVIGFSGAPFTLACYLIEGRPTRDHALARAFMYREPAAWHELLARLSDMVVAYLHAQVEAGADVLQVFDSWIGSLGPAEYRRYLRPYMERIFGALTDAPSIHFGTATSGLLEELAAAGGDVIGLDHRVALDDGWRRVGADRGVQGNLDPARLLAGWEATREGTDAVLAAAAGRAGHIFNLGHGVLPDSDADLMRRVVDRVHERTAVAMPEAVA